MPILQWVSNCMVETMIESKVYNNVRVHNNV